jgi:hypothetical protein
MPAEATGEIFLQLICAGGEADMGEAISISSPIDRGYETTGFLESAGDQFIEDQVPAFRIVRRTPNIEACAAWIEEGLGGGILTNI